jgi:hypothetical protein
MAAVTRVQTCKYASHRCFSTFNQWDEYHWHPVDALLVNLRLASLHHVCATVKCTALQVQQLLACRECQEQQRVQATHCERLFFTVPAAALVGAAKSLVQPHQGVER